MDHDSMAIRGKPVATLAYAAGVVDSDGCISITRRGSLHSLQMQRRLTASYTGFVVVCNTDRPLLDWFKAEFGGSIKFRAHVLPHHKVTYNWAVTNQKAVAFLELIKPYLRVKPRQADAVISLHDITHRYLDRYKGQRDPITKRWIKGMKMPVWEEARREELYVLCRALNDRRPHRPSGSASEEDEAMVGSSAKALEMDGTETIHPVS